MFTHNAIDSLFRLTEGVSRFVEPQGDNEDFAIRVNVPGVRPEDISVDVEHRVLSVTTYKNGKRSTYVGTYQLSESVDVDRISATCDLGVLTISLPLKAEAKPRKVQISVQNSQTALPVGTGTA